MVKDDCFEEQASSRVGLLTVTPRMQEGRLRLFELRHKKASELALADIEVDAFAIRAEDRMRMRHPPGFRPVGVVETMQQHLSRTFDIGEHGTPLVELAAEAGHDGTGDHEPAIGARGGMIAAEVAHGSLDGGAFACRLGLACLGGQPGFCVMLPLLLSYVVKCISVMWRESGCHDGCPHFGFM